MYDLDPRHLGLCMQRMTLSICSIVVAIEATGCGCGSPQRPLPPVGDTKYADIEHLIERTLQPVIYVYALKLAHRPTEIKTLISLGYFEQTSQGYMPTRYGRKWASVDNWPTLSSIRHGQRYDDNDHLTLKIGTYSVQRLISVAHYPGPPCGLFGDEHDAYQFSGKINLNTLGRTLSENHLLYTRAYENTPLRLWNSRQPLNLVWADTDFDERNGYMDAYNDGEAVDLLSSFKSDSK